MKHKNLFYGFAMILTIVGFSLQVLHVENASSVLTFALVLGLLIQSWHLRQLDRKVVEAGEHQNKFLAYGVLVLIVGTAVMEVLHITPGNSFLRWSLVIGILVQSAHIRNLENKLKDKIQAGLD